MLGQLLLHILYGVAFEYQLIFIIAGISVYAILLHFLNIFFSGFHFIVKYTYVSLLIFTRYQHHYKNMNVKKGKA